MSASRHGQHLLTAVRQIIKEFSSSKGLDRILSNVEVVSVEPGRLKAQFKVTEEHLNKHGTLHGGYTSYLTDVVTTVALMTTGNGNPGVSVDLNVSYMRAANVDELVTMDASTNKSGRLLTFSTIDFTNEAGKLLAQGRHTKYVGSG